MAGASGSPEDTAAFVAALLRAAAAGDRDRCAALAEERKGQPEVLGAAVCLLAGELAGLSAATLRAAVRRFERASATLGRQNGR